MIDCKPWAKNRVRAWHAVAVMVLSAALLTVSLPALAQPAAPAAAPQLQPFSSAEELSRYLKEGLLAEAQALVILPAEEAGGAMSLTTWYPDASLAGPATDPTPLEPPTADTIASDGRYLYVLPDAPIELALDAGAEGDGDAAANAAVRVLELVDTPPEALPLAAIDFDRHAVAPSGLYLFSAAGKSGEDLLVTVGNQVRPAAYLWSSPLDRRGKITEAVIYDVSIPESPRAAGRIAIEGQLVASRRTGGSLHLITRFSPSPAGYRPLAFADDAVDANRDIIEKSGLVDLLPAFSIDGGPRGSLVDPATCFKTPAQTAPGAGTGLLTISTIDVSEPALMVSQTVAGSSQTLHVTAQAVYVASVRKEKHPYGESFFLGMQDPPADSRAPEITDIHKFALTEEGALYRGSGSVEGSIGRTADERLLWMDAYRGNLRVVTWRQTEDGRAGSFRLTLLQEAPSWENPGTLVELSRLDNLETLSEDRFRIRFSGRFALVSSRRPGAGLHLIDLQNPHQPSVWNEIPGVGKVDRLVDLENGFLFGLGAQGPAGAPATQPQGLVLLLVDARNPANPVLADLIDIGRQGTRSDACCHRQALVVELASDGTALRLALPIELHDIAEDREPERTIDWIHTGLYLFSAHLKQTPENGGNIGFEGPDVIVADRAVDAPTAYWALNRSTDRVLVLAGAVHFIHRGSVWSAPLRMPTEVVGPR